jgi:hypothetical protein
MFEKVGDVHMESVEPLCTLITPVPGGVGPVTLAMLLRNTLHAAHRFNAAVIDRYIERNKLMVGKEAEETKVALPLPPRAVVGGVPAASGGNAAVEKRPNAIGGGGGGGGQLPSTPSASQPPQFVQGESEQLTTDKVSLETKIKLQTTDRNQVEEKEARKGESSQSTQDKTAGKTVSTEDVPQTDSEVVV